MTETICDQMTSLELVSHNLKEYRFPDFISERAAMFDKLKKEYDEWVKCQQRKPIRISLADGKVIDGTSWETTPLQIAGGISKKLADSAIISKVNNVLWDLTRPLEDDCIVQILDFDSDEGKQVFWHSSAHVLGEAMEGHYHGCLCYGPPIENGFYYDMHMDGKLVSSNDFVGLEQFCSNIVKDQQDFVRLEMTKDDLLKMFHYNPFKLRIINEKIKEPKTTVYKCGPLIDLCRGPHVINTKKIKAISLVKNSSTYWEGNQNSESLQRIYGISFPDSKKMKEWKKFQEEAAQRDHRKLGKEYELFFFNELSPGSCFFLPKGAHIYNTLTEFIRDEYHKRGYTEVVSPNIFNIKLWETSGHWKHYSDNMFSFDVEKDTYALKPMNCPGHCVMFGNRSRSWRELPIRYADFGVLHRNELSGALSGLTRVRRFCQDDAHIFCSMEQLKDEINGCLDFVNHVYGVLGFSMKVHLSTRPEKYLGEIEIWDKAEKELEEALNRNGHPWILNPGDGAFYGPKVDVYICDALNRYHQCGTVQVDFQLPERFNLTYMSQDGSLQKPVIVHRAILGSLERMIAILTENFAGKWPFWLSPNQIAILPVTSAIDEYAESVKKQFHAQKFCVELHSDPGETLNKRIRNAQRAQFNFIIVVGEQEKETNTVNIRSRDNVRHGQKSISEFIEILEQLKRDKVQDSDIKF